MSRRWSDWPRRSPPAPAQRAPSARRTVSPNVRRAPWSARPARDAWRSARNRANRANQANRAWNLSILQVDEVPFNEARDAVEGYCHQGERDEGSEFERGVEVAARDAEQATHPLIADDELADHRAGDRERQAGAQPGEDGGQRQRRLDAAQQRPAARAIQ